MLVLELLLRPAEPRRSSPCVMPRVVKLHQEGERLPAEGPGDSLSFLQDLLAGSCTLVQLYPVESRVVPAPHLGKLDSHVSHVFLGSEPEWICLE